MLPLRVEGFLGLPNEEARKSRGADGGQGLLQKGVSPSPSRCLSKSRWPLDMEAAIGIQALDDGAGHGELGSGEIRL